MKSLDYDFAICNADGEGTTWYYKCPVAMHGHRVDLVYHYILVNPREPRLKIWEGFFHCVNCRLMGSKETMRSYYCDSKRET